MFVTCFPRFGLFPKLPQHFFFRFRHTIEKLPKLQIEMPKQNCFEIKNANPWELMFDILHEYIWHRVIFCYSPCTNKEFQVTFPNLGIFRQRMNSCGNDIPDVAETIQSLPEDQFLPGFNLAESYLPPNANKVFIATSFEKLVPIIFFGTDEISPNTSRYVKVNHDQCGGSFNKSLDTWFQNFNSCANTNIENKKIPANTKMWEVDLLNNSKMCIQMYTAQITQMIVTKGTLKEKRDFFDLEQKILDSLFHLYPKPDIKGEYCCCFCLSFKFIFYYLCRLRQATSNVTLIIDSSTFFYGKFSLEQILSVFIF